MKKYSGFSMPGTRNEGAREPWFLLDINNVLSLILASLCPSASLFLLSKLAISGTST